MPAILPESWHSAKQRECVVDSLPTIEELHSAAASVTGLSDFGPPDYMAGLEVILLSYRHEAALTPLGVRLAREELLAILMARLFSEAGWQRYPAYAEVPVERPVFIIGAPRTGTTTLHRLLTADPRHQGLEMWLGYAPQPRPLRSQWPANPVFQQVQAGVEQFFRHDPEYRGIHDRNASEVEECWLLTRQSMLSAYFEFTGHVPSYSAWLAEQDWTQAYQRHRRNLQLIGLRDPGRRWVLKHSGHMLCLDALFAAYPDALVIQTHRRPASAVLGSACSMVSRLAAGRSPKFQGQSIGPALLELAARALGQFAKDRARHDPARFYDVEFDDFAANPLDVVAGIYQRVGGQLTEDVAAAMAAVLAADGRLRAHRYDIADFGVTPEQADIRLGALL
jgi:Sulfotransferase family